MNSRRLSLQTKLEELLGSRHVYYRPPENLKMEYPCIRYKRDNIVSKHADNINYNNTDRYLLIIIDKNPDNSVIEKLLELSMCSFETHYEVDGLNHDVLSIYY